MTIGQTDKNMSHPQYNEEDIDALEHVSMLIDEYMCCDDSNLTESGKDLKKLVCGFCLQWKRAIEKYAETSAEK